MKPNSLVIEETSVDGTRRRITRHRNPSGGYTKTIEELRGGSWEGVGTEPVTDLDVEGEVGNQDGGDDFNTGP